MPENSAVSESLEFSLSLYSQQAVEETIAAYGALLDCELQVHDSSVRVSLTPKTADIDDLSDHFANHVLHLSIVESRGNFA